MKKKIIFLISQPLNLRNIKRYGFNFFIENNWEVECWNFFYLDKTNKDYENEEKIKNYKFDYLKFFNKIDFIKKTLKIKNDFFYVDCVGRSYVLYQKLLSIKGGKRINADFGLIPLLPRSTVKYNFEKFNLLRLAVILLTKINKKIISFFLPSPYFFFSSGDLGKKLALERGRTPIIEAHNLDYDNYLEIKNIQKLHNNEDYIVYLDQYFENSIDIKMENLKFNKSSEFKNKLINFFNFCKEKYSYEIVVAGNPRREYDSNYFSPYKLIHDKTSELIQNSKMILAHNSTAIQIAILFNKPIILLTSDEIEKIPEINEQIEAFSKELNINILKLEKYYEKDLKIYFLDNSENYNKYIQKYVKSKTSENKKFWEIVISNAEKFISKK